MSVSLSHDLESWEECLVSKMLATQTEDVVLIPCILKLGQRRGDKKSPGVYCEASLVYQ